MFTQRQLKIIEYCAQECKRQRSGEESVYDMLNAWDYARNLPSSKEIQHYLDEVGLKPTEALKEAKKLTLERIENLGKIVEPEDNKKGFRTIPIGVWDGFNWIEKAQWAEVPRLLEHLLNSYYEGFLEPTHEKAKTREDQFYYEYENIHPFVDGNGRSGKIIYNYLLGRLDDPIMPPNFWGSSNP